MYQPVEEQGRLPHTQDQVDMNNAVYLCLCVKPDEPACKGVREAVRDTMKRDKGY